MHGYTPLPCYALQLKAQLKRYKCKHTVHTVHTRRRVRMPNAYNRGKSLTLSVVQLAQRADRSLHASSSFSLKTVGVHWVVLHGEDSELSTRAPNWFFTMCNLSDSFVSIKSKWNSRQIPFKPIASNMYSLINLCFCIINISHVIIIAHQFLL